MSVIISNMSIPHGCQKCKFFKKHSFGNGLDYSYSCILGAKDFPMPWIRQMEERASDCPIGSLEQEPKTEVLDKIRAEIDNALSDGMIHKKTVLGIIDKYKAVSEET